MRPVGTPLAAVPAHPVISFEAAVVPGHLGGPRQLLTGKQRPDLWAQSEEEGDSEREEGRHARRLLCATEGFHTRARFTCPQACIVSPAPQTGSSK